jgi:glycosyltransferase involved in cell wall biosynthesis
MKISIITVCYNSAATIGDTLDSVAKQNWPQVEHIVIDGASTDNTSYMVKSRGGRVTKFVSEPDKGIYDAMNKGIKLATGDIIGLLNADDFYADPDVLARVAKKFESSSIEALFGDVVFFNPNEPDKVIRRYNSGRFSPDKLAWGWMPSHPALFLRKEVYQRVGPFRTDYRIAGDFDFIVRAFGDGKLRYEYVPEVWVKMRAGGVSTGGIRSTIRLNLEVLRACRENGIKTNIFKILSKYPAKFMELLRPHT